MLIFCSRRDCFFHSVLKGLREKNLVSSTTSAREIRIQVGEFMLAYPNLCGGDSYAATCTDADLNDGMPPSFSEYAQAMKGEIGAIGFYQWGGDSELRAITHVYKVNCSVLQADTNSEVHLGMYKFQRHSPDNNDRISMYEVLNEQKLASLATDSEIHLWRMGDHFDYLAQHPTTIVATIGSPPPVEPPTIGSPTIGSPPPVVTVVARPIRVRLREEEKHCSFAQCPTQMRTHHLGTTAQSQFHRIEAGRMAGGQDWAPLAGQVLCGPCLGYFSKYGCLVRGFKGAVVRRRKSKTQYECDYKHCPLSSLGSYYLVVQEGRTAGGKDWTPVVGMRLCGCCLKRTGQPLEEDEEWLDGV
jgi:hypothetical protein